MTKGRWCGYRPAEVSATLQRKSLCNINRVHADERHRDCRLYKLLLAQLSLYIALALVWKTITLQLHL